MEIRHYIIMGKVQGVGYRFFVQEIATSLNVRGWVRNQFDGTVECVAAGEISNVDNFEKKIRKGPPLSRVVNMEREIKQEGDFDIPEEFVVLQ